MKQMLLLSFLFLVLFVISEVLYRVFGVRTERTRKIVHVGTGLLSLLFPLMLDESWQVLTLCLVFAVLLIISQQTQWLPSINNIKRLSFGSLTFPIAVFTLFYIFKQIEMNAQTTLVPLLFYYSPLLTMTLSDPAAAMTGRRYPIRKFKIGPGTKSLGGAAAGFITALIVNLGLIYFFQDQFHYRYVILAIGMAVLCSIAEFFSPFGLDNLTIPLVAVLALLLYESYFPAL